MANTQDTRDNPLLVKLRGTIPVIPVGWSPLFTEVIKKATSPTQERSYVAVFDSDEARARIVFSATPPEFITISVSSTSENTRTLSGEQLTELCEDWFPGKNVKNTDPANGVVYLMVLE